MLRLAILPLAILLAAALPAQADARIQRLQTQVRQLSADLAATRAELAQVRVAFVAQQNAPDPIPARPTRPCPARPPRTATAPPSGNPNSPTSAV